MSFALSVTQPAPTWTEHELVAAVRHGNDRAFEELFSRYRTRIRSYVFGMVGDHGRAEDIAQDVFISALRRLRDTERPIVFKPWIYEIAKNACIDEFRRTRRSHEVSLDGDEDGDGPSRVLFSSAPTPDVAIESKQRLDDLRGAFRGLSETHHKIIVLRELEGLSYTEIGERMGISRAVVESTLFRARRRLSDEYEDLVSGRRCQHVQGVIDACDSRSVRSMGIREKRLLARHLAHCQPCRRHARAAGFDEQLLKGTGLLGKVAALLPFPWLRWRGSGGGAGSPRAFVVQTLPTVSRFATVDPTGSMLFGRAAAAAAALAVAGVGGGIVTGLGTQSAGSPKVSTPYVSAAPSGPGPGGAGRSLSPAVAMWSSVFGPPGMAAVATGQPAAAGSASTVAQGSTASGAGGPAPGASGTSGAGGLPFTSSTSAGTPASDQLGGSPSVGAPQTPTFSGPSSWPGLTLPTWPPPSGSGDPSSSAGNPPFQSPSPPPQSTGDPLPPLTPPSAPSPGESAGVPSIPTPSGGPTGSPPSGTPQTPGDGSLVPSPPGSSTSGGSGVPDTSSVVPQLGKASGLDATLER